LGFKQSSLGHTAQVSRRGRLIGSGFQPLFVLAGMLWSLSTFRSPVSRSTLSR
jgi:hypothetical protein